MGIHGKPVIIDPFPQMHLARFAHFDESGEIPVVLPSQTLGNLPEAICDITDHFDVGKVHGVDGGRGEIDVDHLDAARMHEKRRFLDHVVPDVDDEIGRVNGSVNEIPRRQRGVAQA